MTIFAQHGWGKGNKIETGINDGSLDGVIASPSNETPSNLADFLSRLPPNIERLVDPQLYISTLPERRNDQFGKYPQSCHNLTPASFSLTEIQRLVSVTLDWQNRLDVTAFLSPTVVIDDLAGQWALVASMLAQETVARYGQDKPLLLSLVVEEAALRQQRLVHQWLDELTRFDVDGFYVVVKRTSDSYSQRYEPQALTSLLYLCYSLAELNRYRVIAGYTDMATLLMHAVGVEATASGWYGTLRQFSDHRFLPATRGGRARDRYSSLPLLNSILITELDSIHAGGLITDVLSGTTYDARFQGTSNPENVAWPQGEAALHHWCVLEAIAGLAAGNPPSARLDAARGAILQAQLLYRRLANLVPFTTETGASHLEDWLEGLDRFRTEAAV